MDYDADKKAKKRADAEMNTRLAIINPAGALLNYIPGVRDVVRPLNQVLSKGLSEATVGASNVLAETVRGVNNLLNSGLVKVALSPAGISLNTSALDNLSNNIINQGNSVAEFVRSKDLQADLSKGDIKAQWKADLKTAAYDQIAEQLAPAGVDPKAFSQLWQMYDANQAAKAAKKEEQNQMLSVALQMAAATAISAIPGGAIASSGIWAEIGSAISSAATWVSELPVISQVVSGVSTVASWIGTGVQAIGSSLGIVTSAAPVTLTAAEQGLMIGARVVNAVGQAAIASSYGNDNSTLAGFANGLLLGATGPMGLAGSISYTPPEDKNTLGSILDAGLNGESSYGWGGGIVLGGSKYNGGISFAPGSGVNINFGGTLGGSGGFYNVGYNTESGNTSGSVGLGQEYGSNIGVNLSTDPNQMPSIFAGFGCDVKGKNCGGGAANSLGLGTQITINADGTVNFGAQFLGNQFAGVTYDTTTGSFSDVDWNDSFGNDFTYMNAQNVADEAARRAQIAVNEKYSEILSDSDILRKSEKLQQLAQSMGVSIEGLRDFYTGLKADLHSDNPDKVQEAQIKLNEGMKLIHDEAYGNQEQNQSLKKAIEGSSVIARIENSSSDGSITGDLLTQAKIYLNEIAGNAFGEFAYVNEKGELVFQSCFVAGTLVHTPNGLQAIETLKIGDEVFAFDEESGQKVTRKVTETFINQTTTILKITDSKGEVIETTWNHPFYVTAGMWVKAKDLIVGDEFLTIDGKEIKVASIQESIRDEKVYNLEVEDAHTYYVSENGVLVHNSDYAKDVQTKFTKEYEAAGVLKAEDKIGALLEVARNYWKYGNLETNTQFELRTNESNRKLRDNVSAVENKVREIFGTRISKEDAKYFYLTAADGSIEGKILKGSGYENQYLSSINRNGCTEGGVCSLSSATESLMAAGIKQKDPSKTFSEEAYDTFESLFGSKRPSSIIDKGPMDIVRALSNGNVEAHPIYPPEDGTGKYQLHNIIKQKIDAGYFVSANTNLTTSGHVIQIIGYDDKNKKFIVNDPAGNVNTGYGKAKAISNPTAGMAASYDYFKNGIGDRFLLWFEKKN
ncbi:TIGR04388 family protein [Leptospira licerasiae]|uniref:TIGR04388 family protein n=1 Tax=Leptospira licerasiae TaxID=447106 RepID=UPI0030161F78